MLPVISVLLTVSHLSKSFYHRPVLSSVDLKIVSGDCLALMGKNGAGKSTLLRVLARISSANGGSVDFDGNDILSGPAANRRGILYLGHAPGMYPALSARENLRLMAEFQGGNPSVEAIAQALATVGLQRQADDPIRIYSQGMLQRLKLALALLVDWKLLLFDEPFAGLDAQGRTLVDSVLADWRQQARTMVLVVHDFEWIWQNCSRLALLADGIIQAEFGIADDNRVAAEKLFRELVG